MGQKFLYDEETGIVPKAKRKFLEITGKIDSYLFGEKDEEGKRITTGVFTNTLNTFRIFVDETKVKFNKFLYGDENADSLFKQRGLFGYLKDKWDIILDNSKRFLFGEIDPETNKRKGGIFGQFIQFTTDTIFTPLKNELKKDWGKIKHFFAEEFIKPIKNAMEPFIYEFKIQFQKLKGVFKSGIQLVGNTIDNLFESSFGKPLSKIMVEYVVDPIKNTLKTIKDMAGSILKQILMFPINIIKKSAQDLKERHRLLGAGYAALTPDQEKERFGGFFGMFKKFGDKFNQFNYRRKNKEDFNIVQDIEKKKNTTDVVKDGSVVKVDKQERLDELNKESMKKQNKRIDDKNRLLEEKEKNKKSNPNKEIKKDTKETEKVVNKKEPSPNEEIKKDTKDIVINTDNMNTNIEKVVNANENINDSINKGNSNLLEGLKNGLNNVPENLKNIWSKISNIKFDSIKKSKKGKETISLTEEEDSTDHLKNISSNTKAISKEVKGQLNGVGHNINIIADILTKIAGGLSGIKQGKNKGFKGFLGNLLSFITSPFQAIANVLKHTVTEIIKLPVSIFSKAVKGISSILGSVGKVFGGLVSVVSNVGSGLMSLASSLLKVTLNTVAYITKFIGTVISETVKGITDLASSVISGVIKITVETGKAIAHVGGLILQGIPKAISAITKFSGALMLAALDVAKFAANIIWSGAKLFGKILASPFKALGRFTKKRLSDADGKSKNTAYLTGGIIDLVKNISLFDSAKNINVILSDLTSTVMEKFKNLINGGSGQDNEDDNLVDSTNIVKKTRRVIKRTKNTIKKANEIKDTTKEKAKDVFSNVKDKFDETKENIKGKGFKQVAIEQKQKIKEKLDTLFKNKLTDSTAKTAEHTEALVKDNKGILKWLIIAGGALLTLGKKLKDTITNNVIGKGLEGVGKIVGNALRNSALIRAMGTLLGRRKNVYGPPKPSKFSKLKNKFRESKAGKKLSSVKSSIGKGLTTAKNSITDATKSFGRFVSTKVGSFKSAVKTGLTKIGRFAGPAAAVAASGALMFSDYNESKEAGETGLKVVGTTLLGKTGDTIGGMFKNAGKQALKYGLLGGAIGTAFPVIGNIFGAAAGAVIGAVAGLFGSDPGKAIDNMKTGLANLGASIKQAWNTSIEAIGNTWTEYVKPGLKAVMGLIFSPLQTIENALYKDPFEMTGAERFIAKIIRGIISGFQGFGNAVYNFADRLTGGLLTSVKEGFTYFFNENPIGKTIYGAFLFVKDGINALRGVVSNVWETAKTVVPEFLSGVWEVAKDLGNSFLKVLEDAKDTIKNLGTTITDYLGKKWDSITNWFGSKIDIISNWIGDVLNSALGFLEKIPIVGDLIVGIRNAINWAKKTGGKYTDNVKATIIKTKSTASSIKDAAVNNVTNYTQKFRDRVDEEKINRVANNAQKKAVDKQWDNLDLWNAQQDQADKEKKDEKKKQNDLKQKYGVTSDTAMASLVSGSDESSGFFGSLFNGLKNTLSFFFSPLGSGDSSGGSASGSALDKSLNVISKNEGAYESINRNDNGATSVGKLQWHANRARNLIKTISSSEPSFNQELIAAGGASLIPKLNQDWSNMIITQNEASALKKVLSNSKYNKYQDKLASEDVQGYIEEGKKQGLTDSSALAYYADLYNQGGTNANSVAKKAIAADGGSLASMHQAAQASSVYGEYKNRRQATYAALVSNSSNNISGVTQWPLSGYNTISSPFGSRTDPKTGKPANHLGIDIPAPEGTPIFSASKGIARVNLLDTSIYGNNILVESGKYNYLYGHLSKISVGEGSSVDTSTKIGEVGNTGKSYGNHLHFGVKSLDRNRWVDPLSVVSNSSRTGTGDTSGSSYSDITSGASDISGVTSTSNSEEPPKTFADVKNKLAEINEQNKNIQLVDRNFNLQKVAPDYAMLANNIDYLTASLSDSEKNNYTPNHLQYAANRSSYQNLGADMKQAPTIGNNWRQLIDLSHGTDSQMGEGNYKTVSLGLTTADITNMSNLSRMNAGIIDNNYKEFKGKTKEWLLSELGRTQFAWEEYSLLGKTSEQGWAGVYGSKIREYGKLVGEDLTTGVPKNEWGYIYKPYYRRDYNRPAGANTSLEEYLTIKQRVLELNNQLNKPEILASSNSSISKNNTTDVMASVNPILSSTTGNNVSTVQSVSYEKTIQNATNTALATATSASNDNPGSSFEKMIELLESIANSNKAIASKDLKVEVIDKTGTTDNSTTTTNNSNETNTSLNNKNIFINSNNNNNTALGQTENSKVYSNGINKNISRIAKGA
ncbi:MAG: peptidoglycan DD-metalloendopeptidase family protein [Bacilli bacterium]